METTNEKIKALQTYIDALNDDKNQLKRENEELKRKIRENSKHLTDEQYFAMWGENIDSNE
jgi:uncharacterized protein YeeX (DUF496 family)